MKRFILFIIAAYVLLAIIVGITIYNKINHAVTEYKIASDTTIYVPSFYSKTAKEGLYEALIYYDIKYPDIVYAQAILETGHFKSRVCIENNNLFGLYDSRHNKYCKFDSWIKSVIAYKDWIQKRYNSNQDYYVFLDSINYASSPDYTVVLKQIAESNDKRGYTE